MNAISTMMADDHRACDALFVDLENQVSEQNWERAATALAAFCRASLRHFQMEEQVLFPAFEEATGTTDGPTAVMRMEHEQMRALFGQIQRAAEARDAKRMLGLAESLMVLVQQHNMKEEQILYPMADNFLAGAPGLIERMQAVQVDD